MLLGNLLLASTHDSSMGYRGSAGLEAITFFLLLAVIFRGSWSLRKVLHTGLKAISQFEGCKGLEEIHAFGLTNKELNVLVSITTKLGLSKES